MIARVKGCKVESVDCGLSDLGETLRKHDKTHGKHGCSIPDQVNQQAMLEANITIL